MIRAVFFAFALLVAASGAFAPARASGPYLPALRFYSYSGVDANSDTAFFKGRLGIIRPTFGENRLYAAYRILLGHNFTDDQTRQLLATCCDIRPPAEANKIQDGWLDIAPPSPRRSRSPISIPIARPRITWISLIATRRRSIRRQPR